MSEGHKWVFVLFAVSHKVAEEPGWCCESIDANCVHLLKTINRFYRGFNVSTADRAVQLLIGRSRSGLQCDIG